MLRLRREAGADFRPIRITLGRPQAIVALMVCLLALLALAVALLPALRFARLANPQPLPPGWAKGVLHVHSTFSDGGGGPDTIGAAAAAEGLDFVVLADHGTANREALGATGHHSGVLVVGGSELAVESAHLVVAGVPVPEHRYPPEPQQAIDEVNRAAGVSFIAHPFFYANPWTDWEVTGHTGIELLNAHTLGGRPRPATVWLVPRYLVRPAFAMLTTLEYPRDTVDAWERMTRRGRHLGIFALDAHARLSLGLGRSVGLPTYRQAFALLTVYVKGVGGLAETDPASAAARLVAALRAGSFFNCIEAIAPANGFDAVFAGESGEALEMGGWSAQSSGRLLISLPFGFPTEVVVLRDGERFRRVAPDRGRDLEVAVAKPGVYRVEVYAAGSRFDHLPWIMGNPFFLGTPPPAPTAPPPELRRALAAGPELFQLECDPSSDCATIEPAAAGEAALGGLRYALRVRPGGRDFSAALASRVPRSFTGFEGLRLRVRSERRAHYWLMFRTGSGEDEVWYRRSFPADSEWSSVAVPFAEFRVHHGPSRPPALDQVTAVFISIDNQIAYPGATGSLEVGELGLY